MGDVLGVEWSAAMGLCMHAVLDRWPEVGNVAKARASPS